VFDILLVRPRALVEQIGVEKGSCLADASAVGQGEGEEAGAIVLERTAEHGHGVKVKDGVAVGLGAGELFREATVGPI
jgi:hypothetical protein